MRSGLSPAWTVLRRHRDFRWLFTGNSVSLLGSSVTTVALPLTAVVYLPRHGAGTPADVHGPG